MLCCILVLASLKLFIIWRTAYCLSIVTAFIHTLMHINNMDTTQKNYPYKEKKTQIYSICAECIQYIYTHIYMHTKTHTQYIYGSTVLNCCFEVFHFSLYWVHFRGEYWLYFYSTIYICFSLQIHIFDTKHTGFEKLWCN